MKQTAVEWLTDQINIALKLNGVKLNHGYVINTVLPILNKAKAMEREQIITAFCSGYDHDGDNYDWAETIYYEENYGGEK